jgi:phage terminase Nu1 subunit (DNA packaging protein)
LPTHAADLSHLTTSQLAALTGRKVPTVKKRLGEAGIEPSRKDGRSVWWESRTALAALFGSERLDLSAERAKLTRAQTEKTEIQLAEMRRESVPAGEVEAALVRLASTVVPRLRGVPSKVAPVAHSAQTIAATEQAIRDAIDEALEDIAQAADELDPAA